MGLHSVAAALLAAPELELAPDEARPLSAAVAELEKHFHVPTPDPKWMALGGFIMVAWSVYAPKLTAIKRRKAEAARQKAEGGEAKGGARADPVPPAHSSPFSFELEIPGPQSDLGPAH